jgi:hypothetical protein
MSVVMWGHMKSILDPSFRYTTSFNTNLQQTFARIRCAHRQEAESAVQQTANGETAAANRV